MNTTPASKYIPGHYDYILVGGGLQNGLLALALRQHKPEAHIALIERKTELGADHIWSFHAYDIPQDCQGWFAPLQQWQWPGYDVIFDNYQRRVEKRYGAFSGRQLDRTVREAFERVPFCNLYTSTEASRLDSDRCILSDGRTLYGLVIDSREPDDAPPGTRGHQKYLAVEVELQQPHELTHALLMDARVNQANGFHFIYALPLDEHRLLIEDILFSDQPELDTHQSWHDIEAWLHQRNWKIARVVHERKGLLPMPWRPEPSDTPEQISNGYGGGWFNPATGYCLPSAIRFADYLAQQPLITLNNQLADLRDQHAKQTSFYHLLARLLFKATPAHQQHQLMARFYRLPEDSITRFYAMEMTTLDKLRMFLGTPPKGVSLPTAMSAVGSWIGGRHTRS